MSMIFPFAAVFAMAIIFTVLTIFRQVKFSVVYATLATIFWFAVAGLNLATFPTEPAAYPLSFLWLGIGVVVEIIGLVITLGLLKADREAREMQL